MKKIRSLLVGTGLWAENHIRAYQVCRHVELAGIVDVMPEARSRLVELAGKYNIPCHSQDLRRAVATVKPEMVDIAANPHFRLGAVRQAMGQSVKLFNIEKPMALNPADACAIIELCRRHRKLITVGHQKKWMKTWAEMKRVVSGGKLGRIRFIRGTARGNLLEQGTHLVDMALFMNDYTPVSWVMGQVDDLQGFRKAGAPAPDAAMAMLRFENDVRAFITCGTTGHDIPGEKEFWFQMGMEVFCEQGHVSNSLNQTLTVVNYRRKRTDVTESNWDKTWLQGEADHLDNAALYAVNPRRGHISCLANSIMSFDVIMGIYASAAGEGRVTLPRKFDNRVITRLSARQRRRG